MLRGSSWQADVGRFFVRGDFQEFRCILRTSRRRSCDISRHPHAVSARGRPLTPPPCMGWNEVHRVSAHSALLANGTHPYFHNGLNGLIDDVNRTIPVRFGEIEYHVLEPEFVDQGPPIPFHIAGEEVG